MFKDTFVLKKNAWHMKLMTYIWGLKHYHFSHLCPYFWLSIFNVIISPVFLPVNSDSTESVILTGKEN